MAPTWTSVPRRPREVSPHLDQRPGHGRRAQLFHRPARRRRRPVDGAGGGKPPAESRNMRRIKGHPSPTPASAPSRSVTTCGHVAAARRASAADRPDAPLWPRSPPLAGGDGAAGAGSCASPRRKYLSVSKSAPGRQPDSLGKVQVVDHMPEVRQVSGSGRATPANAASAPSGGGPVSRRPRIYAIWRVQERGGPVPARPRRQIVQIFLGLDRRAVEPEEITSARADRWAA